MAKDKHDKQGRPIGVGVMLTNCDIYVNVVHGRFNKTITVLQELRDLVAGGR